MAEKINPHLFRGYSIRGVADQDLPSQVVVVIAEAIGEYLRQHGIDTVLVGRDVRLSSPRIGRALVDGLLHTGVTVLDAGLVPTPVHNFATDYYGAGAGVMVTASHNPPDYNGLKVRADRTLDSKDLTEIYDLACHSSRIAGRSSRRPTGARKRAKYVQIDPIPDYERQLTADFKLARALSVVVDGGHGASGYLVPNLLRRLGCAVGEINCLPDGHFPSRSPDPTAAGATDMLAVEVLARNAQVGLAYDGDGDRLVVVDETGYPLPGDKLLMILARDVLRAGPANIVYDVSCSHAVAEDVLAHGGCPVMTPTGYAYVYDAMMETGAAVGGEMSGHFFFASQTFRFDDPILATLRLIGLLSRVSEPLSSLVASLPTFHSSPILRMECPDAVKPMVIEEIARFYAKSWPVDTLDGARVNFGHGWALIRASNTQPVLSVRFESKTKEGLAAITDQVMQQIRLVVGRCVVKQQAASE